MRGINPIAIVIMVDPVFLFIENLNRLELFLFCFVLFCIWGICRGIFLFHVFFSNTSFLCPLALVYPILSKLSMTNCDNHLKI